VRKKSGPKRGYVKQLEARLAQVETLLKTQEPEGLRNSTAQQQNNAFTAPTPNDLLQSMPDISPLSNGIDNPMESLPGTFGQLQQGETALPDADLGLNNEFSWEMISLGLEEPLPAQDVIDELNQMYFEKIHPTIPMIHPPRYYAAMNLAPNMRPPICLRYIIWCLAASSTSKYSFLTEHFYVRARKYAVMDEMKGHGEAVVTVGHCQCWSLIALYEFRSMYFPRAWGSTGRASRLASMMGLYRLDGVGLDIKQCLPPARDWTEREERRRTFWIAFCEDRYASVGTGWPMMVDERDILTNLPASEDAFVSSKPQQTMALADILAGKGISTLSPLGGVVLMACLFGRNLTHLHRPGPQDNDHDLNGDFWKRHQAYDNILLSVTLSLPNHLRLPQGINDPNTVFCNMSIHTSTICLHQAAIFMAEKHRLSAQIIAESKRRCIIAANQISNIMRMISHTDLSLISPYNAFCIYVAARVFAQYLKGHPDDDTVRSSLQFLLSALNALRAYSMLTESFIVQLDVDLHGTGLEMPESECGRKVVVPDSHIDNVECAPIFTIRQSQAAGVAVESSMQDGTPFGVSGSSYGQTASQGFSNLPSRQKQPASQYLGSSNYSGSQQGLNPSSGIPSPRTDETGLWTNIDVDFSPDISDRHLSASDKASTTTLNSSTNSSFTPPGTDGPPPQGTSSSFSSPTISAPGATATSKTSGKEIPPFAQFIPATSEAPGDASGVRTTFPLSAGWDYRQSMSGSVNPTEQRGPDSDSLGESQWAQILGDMSWENWRS
jgi:hypothetical protein